MFIEALDNVQQRNSMWGAFKLMNPKQETGTPAFTSRIPIFTKLIHIVRFLGGN